MSSTEKKTGFRDVDAYAWAEHDYPGYDHFVKLAANLAGKPGGNVVEVGPGAGAVTGKLNFSQIKSIQVVEIDPACAEYLCRQIAAGKLKCSEPVRADFIAWANNEERKDTADTEVSTFVFHHIRPSQWQEKMRASENVLRHNGIIVTGDAFLPAHDETNAEERINAHLDLQLGIVMQTFKQGKLRLPIMELEALISGIATTNEFIKDTTGSPPKTVNIAPHSANTSAIKRFKQALEDATQYAKDLGNTHSDAHDPDCDPSGLRKEFIGKLQGTINALESSSIPGIDPQYLKQHPDVCSIGACDYKVTLRQFAALNDQCGYQLEAYKVGSDFEHKYTVSPKEGAEGGLWVTRTVKKILQGPAQSV